MSFVFASIRMSEKTLKLNNVRVNKKEFHKSKQPIDLDLVTIDQIVVSDKFKHSDDGFKYFVGYQEDEIVKPLCIILTQMSGYIKYCIAWITIDSVMKIEKKKNYPQVYLEDCKYKVKKIQMFRFINAELGSDSESESKSDTEL